MNGAYSTIMTEPTPPKKLNRRQKKLIAGIAQGKTITESAIEAGYGRGVNRNSARVQGFEALRKPMVSAALQAAMDRVGLKADQALLVIKDAQKADNVQPGGFVSPDHRTRLEAAKLNLKLHRHLDVDPEPGQGTGSIHAVLINIQNERVRRGLEQPLEQPNQNDAPMAE